MSVENVEIGDLVECKVSGHKGIVNGIVKWITGCDQASVRAPLGVDGKMGESYFIDLHALKVIEKAKVKLDNPAAHIDGGPPTRSPK